MCMQSDYKILQTTLSLRKFLKMSGDLQKLHISDIQNTLENTKSTIKSLNKSSSSSYGKILFSHLKDSYQILNEEFQKISEGKRDQKIENVSNKLGLGKSQIAILLQLRVQDLKSQSHYIQAMSQTADNLMLLKHFFQQTPYPKIKLACLEKIRVWDSVVYEQLYEKLISSCEPEIQAYLRLAS
ncbi:MAG: hypothetical protein KC646_05675 [Candidatus Cloacimonetes bacterium]|nr:hypothetical protein [Candidatus Cloacimonadota bacterium]